MDRQTSRLNDLWVGVCFCHKSPVGTAGIIATSSVNTNDNILGNARCNDVVISFCGHVGIVITCSDTVLTNEIGQARINDVVGGCFIGNIVTSSGNTFNV